MANRRKANVIPRIFGLLLLIAGLSLIGLLWFDILGLVDARQVAYPLLKMFGVTNTERQINAEDPLLLDRERLIKAEENLVITKEELGLKEQDLKKQNDDILQKQNALAEKEKNLDDQMNSFNEQKKLAEDKQRNLDQIAAYLTSMAPDKAVAILVQKEDQEVIDLFRTVEAQAKAQGQDSMVSAWLGKMPPNRAAVISRKMAIKPTN